MLGQTLTVYFSGLLEIGSVALASKRALSLCQLNRGGSKQPPPPPSQGAKHVCSVSAIHRIAGGRESGQESVSRCWIRSAALERRSDALLCLTTPDPTRPTRSLEGFNEHLGRGSPMLGGSESEDPNPAAARSQEGAVSVWMESVFRTADRDNEAPEFETCLISHGAKWWSWPIPCVCCRGLPPISLMMSCSDHGVKTDERHLIHVSCGP